ncbi:MAG: NAD(P)-dependent oxidoreductase [Candidatus Micrarchaeota archaeon]
MGKKKIFVSGGSGFNGKNFIEQAGKEYEIVAPSRKELDLLDSEAVEKYFEKNPVDAVFHCASIGGSRKVKVENLAEKNLRMFFNIIKCKKYWKKMIQCGSGAEYSKLHSNPKMDEEYFGKHLPADDYGFYKYVCSKYIENAEEDIVCLRMFGCYGKYEDYETRFISNNCAKAAFDLPMSIANKNVFFDYLYIDDFVKIVKYFIENRGRYKFYNATPDKPVDLLSIAKKINEVTGKSLEIKVSNPGMGREYTGDNSRLREEIKGLEFTPIEEGIRELCRYYSENKGKLDIEKLKADRY